jgi:cytosine/creatinine deaminase
LREQATVEAMVERALTYCDWAVSTGLLAIRSHVDTTPNHLNTVTALTEVREKVRGYIDLQLVAFPQDGLYRAPNGRQNLIRALDRGVDVVGGIPHFERTMEDGARSVRDLCTIAAERGLPVDLHCDETDDPLSRHVETLAHEVLRHGLQGRAAGSHLTSMHSMDNYYVSKLLPLMAEAGLAAIPQPTDQYRPAGPARQLSQAAWTDPGKGDAGPRHFRRLGAGLRARPVVQPGDRRHAGRGLHGAPCRADDAPRGDAALLRHGHGRECAHPGPEGLRAAAGLRRLARRARCRRPVEALRLRPARLAVVSKGRVVSRQPRGDARLTLPGRPERLNRRHRAG